MPDDGSSRLNSGAGAGLVPSRDPRPEEPDAQSPRPWPGPVRRSTAVLAWEASPVFSIAFVAHPVLGFIRGIVQALRGRTLTRPPLGVGVEVDFSRRLIFLYSQQ
jgi:hypothetical protein